MTISKYIGIIAFMKTKASKTKTGNSSKALGYIRVSTDHQHLGPVAQREAIQRYADAKGIQLVAFYEDLGVSGAAPIERCSGLLNAINDLRSNDAGMLIVAKRDRLAREVVKAAVVERMVREQGAEVVSAAGEGEGSDPSAMLMRTICDAFAEYERATIKARITAAMQVKKARGERVSSSIPLGLRLVDGGKLAQDEVEMRLAHQAREMKTSGMTLANIADAWNASGINLRGRKFHAVRVHRLLKAVA